MRVTDTPRGAIIEMRPLGDPDYFVRGHVTAAEAMAAVVEHCEGYDGDAPELGPCEHVWGRWRPASTSGVALDDDCTHWWDWTHYQTPGWARVTRVWSATEYQDREESRAVDYRMRQLVRRRWPRAEVIRSAGTAWRRRDAAWVCFRLNGIEATWEPWAHRARTVSIRPLRLSECSTRIALLSRWAEGAEAC